MKKKSVFLRVENLTKSYRDLSKHVRTAVRDVSLEIFERECLAIIGESGCGKTTFGKCLLRLIEPDAGSAFYKGIDLFQLEEKKFRTFRTQFQMVFQNPEQALNPRQTVGAALAEPLRVHSGLSKAAALDRAAELLNGVRLEKELLSRFPNQLSGGQRQRVALARAISTNPTFLVADEPTSSLDALLKRHVIKLLRDMQKKYKLTLLLISHDLSMVSDISDRIAVMYLGEIVEIAPAKNLMRAPMHPYSKVLVQSAIHAFRLHQSDDADELTHKNDSIKTATSGCPYASICSIAEKNCFEKNPELREISSAHFVACHLASDVVAVQTYSKAFIEGR